MFFHSTCVQCMHTLDDRPTVCKIASEGKNYKNFVVWGYVCSIRSKYSIVAAFFAQKRNVVVQLCREKNVDLLEYTFTEGSTFTRILTWYHFPSITNRFCWSNRIMIPLWEKCAGFHQGEIGQLVLSEKMGKNANRLFLCLCNLIAN